jgi:hypothetical protein
LVGVAVVGFFAVRRGVRLRDDIAKAECESDTFS